ncbi:MAG TPA: hypothetical protein PKZ83_12710 [bacterium]|nr:hypothetical protein [bacterium]HQJ65833.1 hypothetical protein [bacterium]
MTFLHHSRLSYQHWDEFARIVSLMFGHGPEAHGNVRFRRLVGNAVRWAGGFAE